LKHDQLTIFVTRDVIYGKLHVTCKFAVNLHRLILRKFTA